MEKEPFFLLNEFIEKGRSDLNKVIQTIENKNPKLTEKSVFLRNFTNEMFKAHRRIKLTRSIEKKNLLDSEKLLLLKRKQELLAKLHHISKQSETIQKPLEIKNVVLSRESGKTLVKTEFTGKEYKIQEPELSGEDKQLLVKLKKTIKFNDVENKSELIENIQKLCNELNLKYSDDYYDKIRYYIIRDVKKFGRISPLLEDKDVKEIICNGPNSKIIITYKDEQDILTNFSFENEDELNNFILNIANNTKQKISIENPFLNTTIDKFNIQATIGSEFLKPKFVLTKI